MAKSASDTNRVTLYIGESDREDMLRLADILAEQGKIDVSKRNVASLSDMFRYLIKEELKRQK